MRNTRPIVRHLAALAAVAAAAATSVAVTISPSQVSAAGEAEASLLWLEGELADNGGTLPFPPFDENPPPTDWGLTLDTVLALTAGGRGDQPAAENALTLFGASIGDYITGEGFGDTGSLYAGPVGKSLLAIAVGGGEINDFGGRDLEALSRSAITADGIDAGRFSDTSMFGNNSNGFGQALNIMGLSYTGDGVPAAAVEFLLEQQCPNGGFRLFYEATRGCESDTEVDPDATGLALSALTTIPPSSDTVASIGAATDWLVETQDPTTGGWAGAAPTNYVNSGTTAIVVRGLEAVGEFTASADGREFVVEQQLTAAETSPGNPAEGEQGAIAYTPEARSAALTSGLPAGRDQWRRSTTQAVLVLGLASFGDSFATPLPVEPGRLLDTRDTNRLGAGSTLALQVAGRNGVPADAAAVVLNVTAIGTGPGFVTVHPCLPTPPLASNVNVVAGDVRANAVISALDDDGNVCLTAGPSAVDLVVDVSGFFPAGTGFGSLAPARLLDTRPGEATIDGQQLGAGPIAAGSTIALPVTGRGGVPADAEAAVLNITVIGATGPGFVTVHPCLTTPPVASNVNFTGSGVAANSVISALSDSGEVCLTVGGSSVNLIADVSGYFPAGTGFGPLTPARLLDTRPGESTIDGQQLGAGTIAGGTTIELPVAGRGGVPTGAGSAILNVTVVSDGANGGSFVTVHPCLTTPPGASNVNIPGAGVAANATVAELTDDGKVCLTVGGAGLDVIVDVNGYFG